MRVELLKRLRRKFLKNYVIFKTGHKYEVHYVASRFFGDTFLISTDITTLEKAEKIVRNYVRIDICSKLYDMRRRNVYAVERYLW